jgi:hypothetical protein
MLGTLSIIGAVAAILMAWRREFASHRPLRMVICPDASNAQNSMAAVAAQGSTVCVLIDRLNSSCSRSIAFVVRTLRHWLGGSRVNVKRRSPGSSRLSATAMPFGAGARRTD